MPHWSWAKWYKGAGHSGEEIGLGMTGREGQTHAAGGFNDARRA